MEEKISLKRIKTFFLIFVILFLCLAIWLSYTMFFYDEDSLASLARQYYSDVYVYYPRGIIYDRNAIPLNSEVKKLSDIEVPSYKQRISSNVLGEVAMDKNDTTSLSFKALSGVEKKYDALLNGGTPIIFSCTVDAKGNVVLPSAFTVKGDHVNSGGSVTTTIDYHIQSAAQKLCDEYKKKYNAKNVSVVVAKTGTGEILSLAANSDTLLNGNLLAYSPASVCKTFVLEEALMEGVVKEDDTFYCPGKMVIDGKVCYCNNKEGHKKETLSEAYKNSCNLAFYQIAKKLVYKNGDSLSSKYLDYLSSLNSSYETSLDKTLLFEEYNTVIPTKLYNNLDVFNYCLGQKDLRLTPLFINFTTDIIASNGTTIFPHIIKNAKDPTGKVVESETTDIFVSPLNEKEISFVKSSMQLVTKTGTAAGFKQDAIGGFAGKTGTAETSQEDVNNGLFSGYFPIDNPKYTMTVFIENADSSYVAAKFFYELALEITKME